MILYSFNPLASSYSRGIINPNPTQTSTQHPPRTFLKVFLLATSFRGCRIRFGSAGLLIW